MANWDDIINNHLTMGRSRQLCYAANVERRRRESEEEERRPGTRPPIGRRVGLIPPRFLRWERLWEENFNISTARGRSRPFPTPCPVLQIHHLYQPHRLPRCFAGGFVYVDPNVPFSPRVNNPQPRAPNPHYYVPPPALPKNQAQDAENSSSESSDSEEGNSLKRNHGSP